MPDMIRAQPILVRNGEQLMIDARRVHFEPRNWSSKSFDCSPIFPSNIPFMRNRIGLSFCRSIVEEDMLRRGKTNLAKSM